MRNRTVSAWVLLGLSCLGQACVTQTLPPVRTPTDERPRFVSTVVSVFDGDTVTVTHAGKVEKVRLVSIDCPETDQPFGPQATQLARQLALDKVVTLTDFGRDKYQRLLGELVLPDGRVLNRELVREGFCWWYRKYAPGNTGLEGLEKEAREAKKGLWADPQPVPPWEWRKQRRQALFGSDPAPSTP